MEAGCDCKVVVDTGQPAPYDGHYSYLEHVKEGASCQTRPAVRWSIYLAGRYVAPGLVTCGHDVRWRLDQSLMARKKGVKTKVVTGNDVLESGHYSYLEHVEDGTGCLVHPAAWRGMYLAMGSKAPGLVTCDHPVCWRLDPPSKPDS